MNNSNKVTRTQITKKRKRKNKTQPVAKLGQQRCQHRSCSRSRRRRLTFNIKRSIIAGARPLKIAEHSSLYRNKKRVKAKSVSCRRMRLRMSKRREQLAGGHQGDPVNRRGVKTRTHVISAVCSLNRNRSRSRGRRCLGVPRVRGGSFVCVAQANESWQTGQSAKSGHQAASCIVRTAPTQSHLAPARHRFTGCSRSRCMQPR